MQSGKCQVLLSPAFLWPHLRSVQRSLQASKIQLGEIQMKRSNTDASSWFHTLMLTDNIKQAGCERSRCSRQTCQEPCPQPPGNHTNTVPTFPKDNSLVRRELGLYRLGRQVLSALPEIPLGAAESPEPPEVGSVTAGCFGKRVLHTGQLLSPGKKVAR